MVNPWELDTTLWKVWKVGREMRADESLIQSWRTDSKLLAKTIRWVIVSVLSSAIVVHVNFHTLFPMRTWKTGPNFFAHFPVTVACWSPS